MKLGSNATISCVVTGISSDVDISFTNGSSTLATESGVYTYDSGSFTSGDTNKTATLEIDSIQADSTFTCVVSSLDYPDSEMTYDEISVTVYG